VDREPLAAPARAVRRAGVRHAPQQNDEPRAELVQHQLELKFGELAPDLRERIAGATETELQRWSERLLSAGSLNDVFAT